ncbi:MAG: hypothetical protein L0Z62_35770 [Gemmataceae bacterium]|nr:hypothetical protein [Gemmataceae bacterium]
MPYQIKSVCTACCQSDTFLIGNWPEHLGVYLCSACKALVNVPVDTSSCPGCVQGVEPQNCYDYTFAIPYLGGRFVGDPEPGPTCPKCGRAHLAFENTAHLNMGMVVGNREKAQATWGRDYIEKAIFMNSALPVIEEFQLDPRRVFAYFNLDLPSKPLITKRLSFPIILDIRTHLWSAMRMNPEEFGCKQSREEVMAAMFGPRERPGDPQQQPLQEKKRVCLALKSKCSLCKPLRKLHWTTTSVLQKAVT